MPKDRPYKHRWHPDHGIMKPDAPSEPAQEHAEFTQGETDAIYGGHDRPLFVYVRCPKCGTAIDTFWDDDMIDDEGVYARGYEGDDVCRRCDPEEYQRLKRMFG
jgi:hypothetical protein